MAAPRKDNLADDMYRLYVNGFSLADVGKAFGRTRQSVYKMFRRRELGLRPKKPLPFVVFCGTRYTRRRDGYYRATSGARDLMHRDVWRLHNGKIPDGFDVHHRNGDRSDNRIENLKLLGREEHASRHPGRQNQFTKRGLKALTYRGKTKSVIAWARETGIPRHVIYQRIRAGWKTSRILTQTPNRAVQARKKQARR
jgi:hypothetical protein